MGATAELTDKVLGVATFEAVTEVSSIVAVLRFTRLVVRSVRACSMLYTLPSKAVTSFIEVRILKIRCPMSDEVTELEGLASAATVRVE